jgi:hypothetical protein
MLFERLVINKLNDGIDEHKFYSTTDSNFINKSFTFLASNMLELRLRQSDHPLKNQGCGC